MRRLGLLVPSSNTVMETEFRQMLPNDFTLHVGRLRLREVVPRELEQMERNVEEETEKLADAGVEVIGYGCTSGSLVKGLGHDKIIERRMEQAAGVPAVSTAGAVVEALGMLGVRSVAVATPYVRQVNRFERDFLQASGFDVVDMKGLEIRRNIEIGHLNARRAYRLVKALSHEHADGIFVSCTNFSTIQAIERLERELAKPVVSSNTATLWAMLRRCRNLVKIRGYGRLLGSF